MHGEEQQLQIQQPNWQRNLDPQLLSRVKQIIARRNTEFILDHQNDNQEYKRQEELYKQERAERDRIRKERNEQRNQRRAEARDKNAAKASAKNESETLLSESERREL